MSNESTKHLWIVIINHGLYTLLGCEIYNHLMEDILTP